MPPSDDLVPLSRHAESIQLAALDQLPSAVLVYSLAHGIVFANRACRPLFGSELIKNGCPISGLPITWQTGPRSETEQNGKLHSIDLATNNSDHTVKIVVPPKIDHTAHVRVTELEGLGRDIRMLSFERVRPIDHDIFARYRSAAATPDTDTTGGTASLRKKASLSNLDLQVARLREAIYFSHDAAGFFMDAEETFCFPNWDGVSNIEPVRLKDGHRDLLDWYTVWDTGFRVGVPIHQWPIVRLNRERQKFTWYRVGLRVDGSDLIVETSGDPLFDKDTGEYIGCVLWVRTLGSCEQVMLADMKANLSNYQMICERLPHVLWTMTPEGEVDYFTSNWYQYTGMTEAESLGTGYLKAVHPDDVHHLLLSELADEISPEVGSGHSTEARYKRYDGAWLWFAVASKPLLDSNGKILKWYGTLTEVQTLVAERQEAYRRQVQMQDMLALADVSLFHVDSELQLSVFQGQPFWTNKAHITLFTSLSEVQDGGIPSFESHARAVMDGTSGWADFDFELRDRWYKCRLVKDIDREPDSKNLLGCTIDMTDQHQKSLLLLENTRLLTERSVALEKNRLKDEFLAHMSHEIRTPIAGVIGMAELMYETQLTEMQNDTLRDISESAKNLLVIVNDILDLSKIDSGKMTLERVEVNVSELIELVGRIFQHSIRHKPVQLACGKGFPPDIMMMGDPTKIRQIISNLVSNAIKFTSKGSVTLSVITRPGEIVFTVKDTGIGITQSTIDKLFTPFVQGDSSTARQYGGTGLGLAICRGLAEMMHGSLTIESELGKGTTARLSLPRSMQASLPERSMMITENEKQQIEVQKPRFHAPGTLDGSPTILVVEDNPVNQKFALHLVKKHGYAGVAVANGQEALDYLTGDPVNIAVILMDCQMPIMDGYETTRRIRNDGEYSAWRDVPIVALTASAILGDLQKCEAAGMHKYLTKPVSYNLFRDVVGIWLPPRTKAELAADTKPGQEPV